MIQEALYLLKRRLIPHQIEQAHGVALRAFAHGPEQLKKQTPVIFEFLNLALLADAPAHVMGDIEDAFYALFGAWLANRLSAAEPALVNISGRLRNAVMNERQTLDLRFLHATQAVEALWRLISVVPPSFPREADGTIGRNGCMNGKG